MLASARVQFSKCAVRWHWLPHQQLEGIPRKDSCLLTNKCTLPPLGELVGDFSFSFIQSPQRYSFKMRSQSRKLLLAWTGLLHLARKLDEESAAANTNLPLLSHGLILSSLESLTAVILSHLLQKPQRWSFQTPLLLEETLRCSTAGCTLLPTPQGCHGHQCCIGHLEHVCSATAWSPESASSVSF